MEACTGVGGFNRLSRGRWRAKVLSFPTTVAIAAPEVSTVESETLMVQLTPPNKGLVMLLTSETLEYLRNVVSEQLGTGGCPDTGHVRTNMHKDDRVTTNVMNLFWSYRLSNYRAVFFQSDVNGAKRRRLEFWTRSKPSAIAFTETGDRTLVNEAGNDCEHASEAESGGEEASTAGDDRSD